VGEDVGILQAIRAEPDSDVPRLVYADWLEEHGDEDDRERAEFIRLQIDLDRQKQDSPPRRAKAFRARELLDRHRERWLEPLRRFHVHDAHFVRGFVEKVGLMMDDYVEQAEALFAATPLRRLWVTEARGFACELRFPPDNRLAALNLCGDALDPNSLEDLARLPNLHAVRQLDLQFNDVDDAAARLLCEEPFFQRLSLIRCAGNPMTEEARQRLRDRFGDRVSFVAERDDDHLYCIQKETHRFTAGFGRGHVQVLFYGNDERQRLFLFDHEGNLLAAEVREVPLPERPPGPWQDLPMQARTEWIARRDDAWRAARDAWLRELDLQPATIRVKRFRLDDGSGIVDFPAGWTMVFDDTASAPQDWERGQEWLDGWLTDGKFSYVFAGGSDWWLNAAGEVTDT
jgi:uncharacterized protein (TIGR02996 family)